MPSIHPHFKKSFTEEEINDILRNRKDSAIRLMRHFTPTSLGNYRGSGILSSRLNKEVSSYSPKIECALADYDLRTRGIFFEVKTVSPQPVLFWGLTEHGEWLLVELRNLETVVPTLTINGLKVDELVSRVKSLSPCVILSSLTTFMRSCKSRASRQKDTAEGFLSVAEAEDRLLDLD